MTESLTLVHQEPIVEAVEEPTIELVCGQDIVLGKNTHNLFESIPQVCPPNTGWCGPRVVCRPATEGCFPNNPCPPSVFEPRRPPGMPIPPYPRPPVG